MCSTGSNGAGQRMKRKIIVYNVLPFYSINTNIFFNASFSHEYYYKCSWEMPSRRWWTSRLNWRTKKPIDKLRGFSCSSNKKKWAYKSVPSLLPISKNTKIKGFYCIFSAHVNFIYYNFWYSRLNLVPIPWKGSNISSNITVTKLRLSLSLTTLSLALLMSSLFPTYTKRLLLWLL